MGVSLEFLKDFEYICENEDALDMMIERNRPAENFSRIMAKLRTASSDPFLGERYIRNIQPARELVKSFKLVHNTGIDCLTGIIKERQLLPMQDVEPPIICNRAVCTNSGLDISKYVFCGLQQGDWINGLCELRFNDNVPNDLFLPQSHHCYQAHEVPDYVMDMKGWRDYLSTYIALNFDEPEEYLRNTPFFKRPEFLIKVSLSFRHVQEIRCATKGVYNELKNSLQEVNEASKAILDMIRFNGREDD